MGATQAQILAINRNGSGAIDFQKEALSKMKSYPMDAGIDEHDLLKRKLSLKATKLSKKLKNSDDLYNSIVTLKKSGLLKDMLKRAGINKNYLNEMDASGSPMVPMNNSINTSGINNPLLIKNKYPQNNTNTKNKVLEEINSILKNKQNILKDN